MQESPSSSAEEPVLDRERVIVDAHHHLWHRDSRYLFEEYRADTATGHDIRGSVFVQCHAMLAQDGDPAFAPVGETEFANGVGAMCASGRYGRTRLCAGIVGPADLTMGDRVQPVLERHLERAGSRFRGIRHSTAWHPDPDHGSTLVPAPEGLMMQPGFRAGLARLAPLGLGYDAWLYHPQLPELIDLARTFPETGIVLDHLGMPLGLGPFAGRRADVMTDWRASLAELARCPNVTVKIGGFGMRLWGFDYHAGTGSERLAQLWRPYVDTVLELFTPDRCMFESNFPVDRANVAYRALWNGFKRLAADLTEAEKNALFHGTACRVYRLDLPEE